MKRRTLRFIEKGSGTKVPFLARFTTKQIIIFALLAVAAISGVIAYLLYVRTFGNAAQIVLTAHDSPGYEWEQIASENNIISSYLWGRTKKLMLNHDGEDVMIPTYYKIAGRLVTQPAEGSQVYDLSDQAWLLDCYVEAGDAVAARNLKNRVVSRFHSDSGMYLSFTGNNVTNEQKGIKTTEDNIAWLEAYLRYYCAYGTSRDYEEIKKLIAAIFDETGAVRPEHLDVARYVDSLYYRMTNPKGADPDGNSSLDEAYGINSEEGQGTGEGASVNLKQVVGVKLSNVRLSLIYDLEKNGLIAQGAYDRALKLVKDAKDGDGVPFYAYAYEKAENGINYIYSGSRAGTVDVGDSIMVMANLARVKELDIESYNELKNMLVNERRIMSSYYIVTGNYGGGEAYKQYSYVMELAYDMEDRDLYRAACNSVGTRVATRSSSPAIYMIFRESNGRFTFFASDNLGVRKAV
ncbi:MAG: hypothetical protein K5869_08245 [Saccharofermentans sp.]|nr:hypothetical protein [Saccharofermentans sp.]